jgi:hypothetical protein
MFSTRAAAVCCTLCGLMSGATFAASDPKSIPWQDTGRYQHVDDSGPVRKSRERLRHLRNQRRIATTTPATPIVSADVGDVAVIVDNGSILIPPRAANPFDLAVPSGLRFAPAGTGAFTASATATPLEAVFGPSLALGDDDARPAQAVDTGLFNGGAGFPFLGHSYTTNQIFVGSDGHVTLGEPDAGSTARDAARHIGGPPRISALFDDLDPSVAGSVHANVLADRIVVTWNGVREYAAANVNTFQIVLRATGTIDIAYGRIDARFALVGIAEGHDEGPIHEIDLSAGLPVTLDAGAIVEEFAPAILITQMDTLGLAQEFYKTHADRYDFVVMFTEDPLDIGGGAFAFNHPVHSDTEGLGFFNQDTATTRFDRCDEIGLPAGCELESILNMNQIGLYWPDARKLVDPPIRMFASYCFNEGGQVVPCAARLDGPPGSDQISRRARWFGTDNSDFGHGIFTLGLNSAMSLMGQEAGHRWLAFPAINHPVTGLGPDSTDLLGRSLAHWSWFFNVRVPAAYFGGDPRASSAEGNAIEDLGPDARCVNPGERLFLTSRNELIDGYTTLDHYFIGLRTPTEVGPFWYVDRPTRPGTGVAFSPAQASAGAQDDRFICGRRVDLTIQNITDVGDVIVAPLDSNGTRDPLIGDEQDAGPGITTADDATCTGARRCVDVKTMAFVLLVKDGTPASPRHAASIGQVDTFRRVWEQYGNGPATGGRGARGEIGQANYIKKFDTSLAPIIH